MEEDSDDDEIEFNENIHHITSQTIINSIKKSIYDALFDYFNTPPKAALLASLLDSRFKKMHGWPNDIQNIAISSLKEEYWLIKDAEATTTQRNINPIPIYPIGGFKSRLFGSNEIDEEYNDDEINCYLDNIKTPQALPETDPLQWWIDHKSRFPTVFKIARKYLNIPATSVPSERLFSDAGNQITNDRNRLKPESVNELLFIKRNNEYYNPFVCNS